MGINMKTDLLERLIQNFLVAFEEKEVVTKKNLIEIFNRIYPSAVDKDYQLFTYQLISKKIILPVGSGVFLIRSNARPLFTNKIVFAPEKSSFLLAIEDEIGSNLTYLSITVWETRVLNDLMTQQPAINMAVVETEPESIGVVFDFLGQRFADRIFISPDKKVIDNYVLTKPESILVSKCITQTALGRKRQNPRYAKLEKILVDIFVDKTRFFIFQGSELISIYENAFKKYLIDEVSMFRYAGRRNAREKIQTFIREKTNIELITELIKPK
jgi:hypothetical protein